MGSPSARLKTPEKLRPWLESGLEFVLNPGGAEQAVAQAPVQAQGIPQQQAAQVQQHVQSVAPIQQPAAAPQSNAQPQAVAPQQAVPANQAAQPVQQSQSQPQQQAAPSAASTANFPQPWATFLAKVPPQPKVLWTYMELGLDLAGQADPKRGAVLRNLLAHHLKWPPGTTAFWPVAALQNNALQPDRNMFWRGWDLWKTPYIACFGEEALKIMHPAAEPGGTTYLLENVTIFVLPPLAKLISMLPHEQQISVDALAGIRL